MTRPPDIKLCPLLGLVLTFCSVINFVLAEEPASKFLILTGKPEEKATKSEFLDIDNPSNTCKLPDFPTTLYDAVAGFTKKGPLICSGNDGSRSSDCYLLTRDRQFKKSKSKLRTARYEASSIVTDDGELWVTGGYFGTNDYLDTTELVTTQRQRYSTRLKKQVYGHCVTRINATRAILTGGVTGGGANSESTYFIDLTTMKVLEEGPEPNLNVARLNHGCTTFRHKNDIVVLVAGGRRGICPLGIFCTAYVHLNSWEFLNLSDEELSWKKFDNSHPLPFKLYYFSLVSSTRGPLAIGGYNHEDGIQSRKILRLDCGSLDDISQCDWKEEEEMTLEVGRYGHVVIPLGDAFAHEICSTDCRNVNNCNLTSSICRYNESLFGDRDNYYGSQCRCKPGFFWKNSENKSEGCQPCICSKKGSKDGSFCNPQNGRCHCKPNVEGDKCDRCKSNYWNFANANANVNGCESCDCSEFGRKSNECNRTTGTCECHENYGGPQCYQCNRANGYHHYPTCDTNYQPHTLNNQRNCTCGKKLKTSLDCKVEFISRLKRTVCKGTSLMTEVVNCNSNDTCPPDLSECSCFETLDDMTNSIGKNKNCEFKLCAFKDRCPKYHINLYADKNDKSKMCGDFSIEQSKVQLGELTSQKIELINTLTKAPVEAVWTNKTGNFDPKSTRKICNLQPNITYMPEIIIESNVTLAPLASIGALEENVFATVIQKCTAKHFTIITEGSTCKDGKQKIPKSFRCDKEYDCDDNSDEDKTDCGGGTNYYILYVCLAYFGIGFLSFGTALWLLPKEEKVHNLGQDDVKLEPFDRRLLNIFNSKFTRNCELTDEQKYYIKDKYFSAKDNDDKKRIKMIFRLLRNCGNPHVVKQVMKFILKIEEEYKTNTTDDVIAWLMESIQDDLELRSWAIDVLRQSLTYRISRCLRVNLNPVHFLLKRTKQYVMPIGFALRMIAAITFDIWKDLVIFCSLRHYIDHILEGQVNFDFIGNYDLNIISWYIIGMATLSQVTMSTYAVGFMIQNKERFQAEKNIGPFKWTIMTILAFFFPTHFSCLLTLVQKISYARQQNNLKGFLQSFEDKTEQAQRPLSDFEALEIQRYSKLCHSMEETKEEYVRLEKLKQANARCETILETLPTTVFLISLGLMSYVYKPLRLFMENDILLDQFPIPYVWFIIIVCCKVASSCIFAVVKIRNAKRLPLKPSLLGLFLQLLMAITLFLPKIMVTSLALLRVPYIYPLTLAAEYLMILAYNKLFYGSFCALDVSNLATIITPALYQPPNHTNISANDRLNKYGRLMHIVFLYLLPFFMYAHVGYYLHQVEFKDVSIIANDKVIWQHADVMIFDIYFGALLVYMLLALVYYRFFHHWSSHIKGKREKKIFAMSRRGKYDVNQAETSL